MFDEQVTTWRAQTVADLKALYCNESTKQIMDARFIGLQTHTGQVLFRRIRWKGL